ncbi:transglycosylase SLT domain-containing protein [Thermodesulfobacteriota bacterium]
MMRWNDSKSIFSTLCMTFVISTFLWTGYCAASEPFPIYPSIQPNVAFWKNIFSKYTTNQGIIHDSLDLRIIYDVIKLKKSDSHNAYRINRDRMKRAVNKYKPILESLSIGRSPSTPEGKRVLVLFGPGASRTDFRKASDRIRCQAGLRDRFRKSIIRSGAYIDEIRRIFRSHALPEDLSYLPHVESSFNPKAYSKAGAAGIWQFTRSTGKRLMKVDYTVDERWDPIRASHAAARLLKESHKILGHWPLALTAYNHGISGMLRAKRSKGGYEEIFKGYKSRTFKFASRNFYSEFLAARDVAKNANKYFGELALEKPLKSRIREVVLKNYVPIQDLARHLKIDRALLRSLNPSLREPVHKGQKYIPKGYALLLPVKALGEKVVASAVLPNHLYRPKQKRTLFYRVQKGDTAGKIAGRHGIRLSDLILANNLDPRAIIYAGDNLRIPANSETNSEKAKTESVRQKASKPLTKRASSNIGSRPVKYSASKASPEKWADKKDTPETGERPINPDIVTGNFLVEKVVSKKGRRIGIIRVEVEETLGHYADWLGIATRDIRMLNGFRSKRKIHIHDSLKIPLEKISKEAFEEKRFEYHKELQEDFFASFRVKDVEMYQIKNGDNLWTLCHEVFEIPFWLFYKYNSQVNIHRLSPSQKMIFPRVEEINKT